MALTNSQLRQAALASLKGRWGAPILTAVIYCAIVGVVTSIPCVSFVSFLLTIPLGYGLSIWFLNFFRSGDGKAPELVEIFDGFKDYVRIFITMFLVGLYTILWALLFIVPGVIKALSYAMTPYILKDNPTMENNEAIELSMAMMDGYKMKLFLMQLNYIMWTFLSCLTLGIGLLWVMPYMWTTSAAFYEDVKSDYERRTIAQTVA